MCAIAGEWGMPTHWPSGLIPVRRNQSRKVRALALKKMIINVKNPNIEINELRDPTE